MNINANTKISVLLKGHPEALDAIVSITPKFNKLRNPLLRKLMAGRTSIAMASKISGHPIQEFFDKLAPLGFEADSTVAADTDKPHEVPAYLHGINPENVITLDVRPTIESGKDPLREITQAVKTIPEKGALKVINSFEPTPLISLLEKQGYDSFVDPVSEEVIETWFYKTGNKKATAEIEPEIKEEGWEEMLKTYEGHLSNIDVRSLPMPQPLHAILENLETLPTENALFVYHKRIPVFLLPELRDRGFDYRIKELEEGQVRLLIFKE